MATSIHRCKVCNTITRVEYRKEVRNIGYGRKEAVYFRKSDGAMHVQPVKCCGRDTGWNWLKSFLNPAVKCDARCTHAKGFQCECSCGGENHGTSGMFTNLLAAACPCPQQPSQSSPALSGSARQSTPNPPIGD